MFCLHCTRSIITNPTRGSGRGLVIFLVILMWLFSLGSAMGVVYSTYESRRATQELEQLKREANRLRVVSGQFLLEKSSWAAYSRVEKVAVQELNMIVPERGKTVLVYKK